MTEFEQAAERSLRKRPRMTVDLSDEAVRARLGAMTEEQLAGWYRISAGGSDRVFRRLLSEEIGRRDATGGKGGQR